MQDRLASADGAGKLVPKGGAALPAYGETEFDGYHGYYGGEAERTGLFEFWRMLYKHRWRALSIVGACVVLGLLRTLMATPLYTSAARLQIERNAAKAFEQGSVAPAEGMDFEFLRTQYELLQGRAVAERVVSSLDLANDPGLVDEGDGPQSAFESVVSSVFGPPRAPSRVARERAAVDAVLANRLVKPVSGSRLVDIAYSDPDPDRARKIAEALAQAFVDFNLDKRFQVNAFAKTFLEDQLKQLQIRLQNSERTLVDFGQKEQIVTTNEKSSIAEMNLAAGNAALGGLIAERIRNEQLFKQIEKAKAVNFPQFLSNKSVEALREKRNTLVTEYKENLETFKPSYPRMVQLNNKIKEVDRQIGVEVKAIRDSLRGAYQASLSQETEMKTRIETLREEVLDLQKRSIQYNILKREVDTNRSLYENLLQRYKEVDVASGAGANNVFVVERARTPTTPSSPNLVVNLSLSLLIGAVIALVVVFVMEKLDDTVGSAEELERVTGLATLGLIPKVEGEADAIASELAEIRSIVSESYRSLCTALHFATESGLPKSLLVTSSGVGEGKSTTAFAVARHFATLGLKVLVIDADLRRPSLHGRLGLDNSVGLSNYLTGGCPAAATMQETQTHNLIFMSSGPIPPNPADLLASSRFLTLLSSAAETFDFVVVDGPPVVGLADAQLLANVAAATIFVVRSSGTRKALLRNSLKRLRFARANLIGAVLTHHDAKSAGHPYGYEYGYGDDQAARIETRERQGELCDERLSA